MSSAFFRHPKNIFGFVFVLVLRVGADVIALACDQFGVMLFEGARDVFEEDETEHYMLILRRVHVVAELVGSQPELGLEAETGGGIFGAVRFGASRGDYVWRTSVQWLR